MNKLLNFFYYEHCPFCIRVLAVSGLVRIEFEKKILLNDDENTPIRMVGEKIVPILQKKSGDFMTESLDIVDYLCKKKNLSLNKCPEEINAANSFLANNRISVYSLAMPRWVQLPFGEFATDSAISYFIQKKTKSIGDFSVALANTDFFVDSLCSALVSESDLFERLSAKPDSQASIILFSGLHGVSCVKGFRWPNSSNRFMVEMSEAYNVSLLTEQAL